MKKIIATLAVCALALTGYSQSTSTNATDIPSTWDNIVDFVSHGSNWIVTSYGIYATGGTVDGGSKNVDPAWGVGLAGLYKINDYVLTGLGLDYLPGSGGSGLTMPSASAQLQYPIKMGRFVFTPLAYSGLATAIGGHGIDNGEAIGIFGTGAALSFTGHVGGFGSLEKRTSFEGHWIKFGLFYRF